VIALRNTLSSSPQYDDRVHRGRECSIAAARFTVGHESVRKEEGEQASMKGFPRTSEAREVAGRRRRGGSGAGAAPMLQRWLFPFAVPIGFAASPAVNIVKSKP
jgi:hypothetical protein